MCGGLTCLLGVWATCGFVFAEEGPAPGVVLSEIMFLPGGTNDPQWVEVANLGDKPVSIAGWCITDYRGNTYTFPAGVPALPTQAVAAVVFWPPDKERPKDDLSFEGDRGIVLYHPCGKDWKTNALDEDAGRCGLYNSSTLSTNTLVDFVCWGMLASADSLDPVQIGIWRDFEYVVTKEKERLDGGPGTIRRGTSIARLDCGKSRKHDWYRCKAPDVSLGKPNPLPKPDILSYALRGVCYPRGFSWRCPRWYAQYQCQIATDKDFKSVFLDQTVKGGVGGGGGDYDMVHLPKPGRYYCRVRGVTEDGRKTAWAEDYFTVDKPPSEIYEESKRKDAK